MGIGCASHGASALERKRTSVLRLTFLPISSFFGGIFRKALIIFWIAQSISILLINHARTIKLGVYWCFPVSNWFNSPSWSLIAWRILWAIVQLILCSRRSADEVIQWLTIETFSAIAKRVNWAHLHYVRAKLPSRSRLSTNDNKTHTHTHSGIPTNSSKSSEGNPTAGDVVVVVVNLFAVMGELSIVYAALWHNFYWQLFAFRVEWLFDLNA